MPTLTKGWLESQAAFEARNAAEAKKEQDALDASVKNGTAGRIVNDPEDQKRVAKYRQEQARLRKEKEAEAAVLNARRQSAKDFQYQQELESSKTQVKLEDKKLPAVAQRLSLWKPKRHQPVDAATQTLEATRLMRNV